MKGSWRPLILMAFLILLVTVTVVFSQVIFSQAESEINFTAMSSAQNQSYNSTVGMVQIGNTGLSVVGWILVLGCILFGIFMIARAVR